ncbi:hypothetical protein [Conexibacter sp. CPCC 206217]|uniref:hypothetical protein n=1 Tax=Conexibacter sp. CPCC 206217 TaxID=3064574 RepID=UPI00272892E0|nr:hypothetical protein [Conexibacter sp. CPCC 206217]MDO8213919.1 hypothetical protein [Conexibacter sp. CPCC 206217]
MYMFAANVVRSSVSQFASRALVGALMVLVVMGSALVGATPSEAAYCYAATPAHSQCPVINSYNFNDADMNGAYYYGTPGIRVCQRVTNQADTITVSRRCDVREAYSYSDIATWVQCSGGNPFGIRYAAGNDSDFTHTIQGTAYLQGYRCV